LIPAERGYARPGDLPVLVLGDVRMRAHGFLDLARAQAVPGHVDVVVGAPDWIPASAWMTYSELP